MTDPLHDLLVAVNLSPGRNADYLKMWCPFHPNPSGKTLWVSHQTGRWGCLSTRCAQHNDGHSQPLVDLLVLRGMNEAVARSVINTLDLTKAEAQDRSTSLRDRDFRGTITEAHLVLWEVDWYLASAVCEAVMRTGGHGYDSTKPVSSWAPGCPASPGQVEHDHWEWLWYPLVVRGLHPTALSLMDVGFDRERGVLVFPLRGPSGDLRGVARRECRDKADYILGGCVWVQGEPDYHFHKVERADTFFGWSAMRDRIERGHPVVVVEGYADQLRLASYGYVAVAKLSNQMTLGQHDLLRTAPGPKILWPDFDRAGLAGAREEATRLVQQPDVRVVSDFGGVNDAGSKQMSAGLAARSLASALHPVVWLSKFTNLLAAAS